MLFVCMQGIARQKAREANSSKLLLLPVQSRRGLFSFWHFVCLHAWHRTDTAKGQSSKQQRRRQQVAFTAGSVASWPAFPLLMASPTTLRCRVTFICLFLLLVFLFHLFVLLEYVFILLVCASASHGLKVFNVWSLISEDKV